MATEADLGWYVLNTYSGYELMARRSLLAQINSKKMADHFADPVEDAILVPTEDVEATVAGKPRIRKKKFFPGYMLVHMAWNPEVATFVRSIPKIIGFVGARKNMPERRPPQVSDDEVARLLGQIVAGEESPTRRLQVSEGDRIRVIEGPFLNFCGVVEEVEEERERLRVSFEILGRPTPVDLEFKQVALDSQAGD